MFGFYENLKNIFFLNNGIYLKAYMIIGVLRDKPTFWHRKHLIFNLFVTGALFFEKLEKLIIVESEWVSKVGDVEHLYFRAEKSFPVLHFVIARVTHLYIWSVKLTFTTKLGVVLPVENSLSQSGLSWYNSILHGKDQPLVSALLHYFSMGYNYSLFHWIWL